MLMLVYPSKKQRRRACSGQSGHEGAQVNKEAAMFLDCSIAFIYVRFLLVPASQGLFWQVLFCKLYFFLFLLRKSQGKRSPTGIFWTDASQTVSALKIIPKIFSAVLYMKKNISTGNIWNINKSLFWIQTRFFFFSMVCCITINIL